jgi:pimeloyl-ACP methyl ester carboxylesterase
VTRTGQLAPHSARAITLELPSGTIAALRADPSSGRATADVLLVPGFTGSKEDFVPVLDLLAAAGLRVTTIDLPGQFESRGPDEPAAYTPDHLATCLLQVIAELDGPVHLVGHSFGGLVARSAVISQPHAVADLVLMSSGPAAIGGARRERLEYLAPVLPVIGLPGVWAALQQGYAADPGYVPPGPELDAFLERRFLAGNPAMLLGMGAALAAEPDRVDELCATGIRTLVLHGANDDAWLPDVQREMALRLGAEYLMVEDAAHSPAAENPDATARALIEFWRAS